VDWCRGGGRVVGCWNTDVGRVSCTVVVVMGITRHVGGRLVVVTSMSLWGGDEKVNYRFRRNSHSW